MFFWCLYVCVRWSSDDITKIWSDPDNYLDSLQFL